MNDKRQEYIEKCKENFQKWAQDNRYLVRYVRDGKRNRVGVVVARLNAAGVLEFGWSKANVSKNEKFDRYIGLNTAIQRVEGVKDMPQATPRRVHQTLTKLAGSALRYFHLNAEELKEKTLQWAINNGLPRTYASQFGTFLSEIYATE